MMGGRVCPRVAWRGLSSLAALERLVVLQPEDDFAQGELGTDHPTRRSEPGLDLPGASLPEEHGEDGAALGVEDQGASPPPPRAQSSSVAAVGAPGGVTSGGGRRLKMVVSYGRAGGRTRPDSISAIRTGSVIQSRQGSEIGSVDRTVTGTSTRSVTPSTPCVNWG